MEKVIDVGLFVSKTRNNRETSKYETGRCGEIEK